jgi:hypothetical protein
VQKPKLQSSSVLQVGRHIELAQAACAPSAWLQSPFVAQAREHEYIESSQVSPGRQSSSFEQYSPIACPPMRLHVLMSHRKPARQPSLSPLQRVTHSFA